MVDNVLGTLALPFGLPGRWSEIQVPMVTEGQLLSSLLLLTLLANQALRWVSDPGSESVK